MKVQFHAFTTLVTDGGVSRFTIHNHPPLECELRKFQDMVLLHSKKVKLSRNGSSTSIGLRDVEVPTFLDNRLTDGSEAVSPTRRLPFTSRKNPGTHLC
jgi:hypothetical protein